MHTVPVDAVVPGSDRIPEARVRSLSSQRNSMFLYSLLKSAANAVLKLMSVVIAIAHVLFVSIESLSVNIMLLEYSFAKI